MRRTLPPALDLIDAAAARGDLLQLGIAITAAGLVGTLRSAGPFTLFAPTDRAFAQFPQEKLDDLYSKEHRSELVEFVTYHLVAGRWTMRDLLAKRSITSMNGRSLTLVAIASEMTVNRATIVEADIGASNGVIHAVDHLILPRLPTGRAPPGGSGGMRKVSGAARDAHRNRRISCLT